MGGETPEPIELYHGKQKLKKERKREAQAKAPRVDLQARQQILYRASALPGGPCGWSPPWGRAEELGALTQ